MKFLLPLLALPLFILPGCRSDEDSALSNEPLTSEQLLQAMDGYAFDVTLPGDLGPDDSVSLAILRPDGKIEPLMKHPGWEGVRSVKVVCFPREAGGLRWIYFYDNITSSGQLPNFPKIKGSSVNNERRLTTGERLIRFNSNENSNGQTSNAPAPIGDEFDLIFHVEKSTGR